MRQFRGLEKQKLRSSEKPGESIGVAPMLTGKQKESSNFRSLKLRKTPGSSKGYKTPWGRLNDSEMSMVVCNYPFHYFIGKLSLYSFLTLNIHCNSSYIGVVSVHSPKKILPRKLTYIFLPKNYDFPACHLSLLPFMPLHQLKTGS